MRGPELLRFVRSISATLASEDEASHPPAQPSSRRTVPYRPEHIPGFDAELGGPMGADVEPEATAGVVEVHCQVA